MLATSSISGWMVNRCDCFVGVIDRAICEDIDLNGGLDQILVGHGMSLSSKTPA
jgi:hypothetical protein